MEEKQIAQNSKYHQQLKVLYEWVTIARNPNKKSLQLDIPISENQIKVLLSIINPDNSKEELTLNDFLSCFTVQQENKKIKEKQLASAFKYIGSISKINKNQPKNQDPIITFQLLQSLFEEEHFDPQLYGFILKQLGQWQNQDHSFNFKKFINELY